MDEKDEIERVKASIRRLMAAKNLKAKPLSKLAGKGETFVRDMFEAADVKIGPLHSIANALEVSVADIVGGDEMRISGKVGAGGSLIFEEVDLGPTARPAGFGDKLQAFEIDGSSMLPRYSSGDVVYISRDTDGVDERDIGEFCAVRIKTGETYVKQLAYGSRPGFFTLRSLNAEDITDVELEWATPIVFVLPRAARRRLGYGPSI
jgi:repressor LexA